MMLPAPSKTNAGVNILDDLTNGMTTQVLTQAIQHVSGDDRSFKYTLEEKDCEKGRLETQEQQADDKGD